MGKAKSENRKIVCITGALAAAEKAGRCLADREAKGLLPTTPDSFELLGGWAGWCPEDDDCRRIGGEYWGEARASAVKRWGEILDARRRVVDPRFAEVSGILDELIAEAERLGEHYERCRDDHDADDHKEKIKRLRRRLERVAAPVPEKSCACCAAELPPTWGERFCSVTCAAEWRRGEDDAGQDMEAAS